MNSRKRLAKQYLSFPTPYIFDTSMASTKWHVFLWTGPPVMTVPALDALELRIRSRSSRVAQRVLWSVFPCSWTPVWAAIRGTPLLPAGLCRGFVSYFLRCHYKPEMRKAQGTQCKDVSLTWHFKMGRRGGKHSSRNAWWRLQPCTVRGR